MLPMSQDEIFQVCVLFPRNIYSALKSRWLVGLFCGM